jgi:UDP-N-acetylglucosamine diphosphorylase/glucosamine-1-phosphate N-acetyltransferase
MTYILFDDATRNQLLPFTHTRPIADIRCGILTMRERWERHLYNAFPANTNATQETHITTGTLTVGYLQKVFPSNAWTDNIYINGSVFATDALAATIVALPLGEALMHGSIVLAARLTKACAGWSDLVNELTALPAKQYDGEVHRLRSVWDIFTSNDLAIRHDFSLITRGRKSAPIPAGITVTGGHDLFIEEGANIYAGCIINAAAGPVYIAKDAEVLEGVMIRGPLAVCGQAVIKMGAKIYGATTIGPGCKVGGEINNVVFFANSNKAHDGYLGNAVIGEWCNLGADTNCSNLKNNYSEIKIWDEAANKSVTTGLTFCGLLMGDHSKCAINSMFNTGTVVGVSCNIYGGGFPEKFIRSFSWGGVETTKPYDFNRAMETADRMMARRNKKLSGDEIEMYRHIFDNVYKS